MNNSADIDLVELEGFAPKDLYAKREKIFTRYIGGKFQRLRFYTGWPLLFGYFVLPWLMWGGRQAVLFDLPARQFHLAGLTIWPQDLWLLGWLLMVSAFALFALTTVVGRLWCGYTCPQTVWTAIFMWVEQITEGTRNQRMRLDRAAWSWNKLWRRASKHTLWLAWAGLTGLTFVGYFTPIRELSLNLLSLDMAAAGGWAIFWVLFFTAATYFNAGWLREQVCLYMCPYARFQSAMIDKDTLIVSYDQQRGEPRGSRKRLQTTEQRSLLGDCVNCQLCVQVCPTGIDIRDGLQYQCIGCAHCIDACNQVMQKMNYAPDLISYTTLTNLSGGRTRLLRPRSFGYAIVCSVIAAGFVVALLLRAPLAVDIMRDRGDLYTQAPDGAISNHYQLVLMNKTQQDTQLSISVNAVPVLELASDKVVDVGAGEVVNVPMELRAAAGTPALLDAEVTVCQPSPGACVSETTRFISSLEPSHG